MRVTTGSERPWQHHTVVVWKGMTDEPLCRLFHADNKTDAMDEAKYWAQGNLTVKWFLTYLGVEPR